MHISPKNLPLLSRRCFNNSKKRKAFAYKGNQIEVYPNYIEDKTRSDQIGAIGEIAKIETKKLSDGNKSIRLTIDLNAYPGLVGALDNLWDVEKTIKLLIWRNEA